MAERVLVTGAMGFVGGHVIARLLEGGHDVRATVRAAGKTAEARARLGKILSPLLGQDPGARLEIVAADLTADAGWAEAADGCAYVHHVASPFPMAQPKTDDELVAPARDGAVRVVRAAAKAGAKRVVLTSSVAAVIYGSKPSVGDRYTEADWSVPTHPENTPYSRSKTIAEQAARAAAKAAGVEFVALNPSGIIGPVLHDDLSTSIQLVRRPLVGDVPGAPRLGYAVVDVRDLADAHIRAMTAPGIDGERFIVSGRTLWLGEVADLLKARYPDRKIKTNRVPDIALHLAALFDPALREPARNLGKSRAFDTSKARGVLGWTSRKEEDSVIDTAESLIRLGLA